MRYLKVWEAKTPDELKREFLGYYSQLDELTGFSSYDSEIDDLFIELKDELLNNYLRFRKSGELELTYKKSNIRKSAISTSYYKQMVDYSISRPMSEDVRYLGGFLQKCKFAKKLVFTQVVEMSVTFENRASLTLDDFQKPPKDELDLDSYKSMISEIIERAKSLGYNIKLSDTNPNNGRFVDLDSAFNGVNDHLTLWIVFEIEIDTTNFEKDEDIQSKVISDFEEFVTRKGFTEDDKQELLNIIKRGNWKK
jgi:hypothetical protein